MPEGTGRSTPAGAPDISIVVPYFGEADNPVNYRSENRFVALGIFSESGGRPLARSGGRPLFIVERIAGPQVSAELIDPVAPPVEGAEPEQC